MTQFLKGILDSTRGQSSTTFVDQVGFMTRHCWDRSMSHFCRYRKISQVNNWKQLIDRQLVVLLLTSRRGKTWQFIIVHRRWSFTIKLLFVKVSADYNFSLPLRAMVTDWQTRLVYEWKFYNCTQGKCLLIGARWKVGKKVLMFDTHASFMNNLLGVYFA